MTRFATEVAAAATKVRLPPAVGAPQPHEPPTEPHDFAMVAVGKRRRGTVRWIRAVTLSVAVATAVGACGEDPMAAPEPEPGLDQGRLAFSRDGDVVTVPLSDPRSYALFPIAEANHARPGVDWSPDGTLLTVVGKFGTFDARAELRLYQDRRDAHPAGRPARTRPDGQSVDAHGRVVVSGR